MRERGITHLLCQRRRGVTDTVQYPGGLNASHTARHKATQKKVTDAIKAAFHTTPNNGYNFRLYLTSSGLSTEQDTHRDTKLYQSGDNLWFKDYKIIASHEDFYDCEASGVNEGRMTQ